MDIIDTTDTQRAVRAETGTIVKQDPYKKFLKRLVDIYCSLLAMVALTPLLLIIALLIRIKLGSPVIFKQLRPGLNEKIFTLYKFRTMTSERDSSGNPLPDNARLTRFGKTLRSTSLDELPEVFNILAGNMSFVGPRPQLIKDLVFMSPEERLRHTVKPGLTGWAQVNGRNSITWDEKFALDLEYIRNITFIGDCKIVLLTVIKVFKKQGIGAPDNDIAEDYGDYLLRNKRITKDEYTAIIADTGIIRRTWVEDMGLFSKSGNG